MNRVGPTAKDLIGSPVGETAPYWKAWIKKAKRNARRRALYRAKRDGITVDEAARFNDLDLEHSMMDLTDLDDADVKEVSRPPNEDLTTPNHISKD